MEYLEAQQELCKELNIDFSDVSAGTNDLFSLADIKGFILSAAQRAWDYKPWTFTEGIVIATPNPTTASYDYPETFEDESIFLIEVNGVPWTGRESGKRNFAEYKRFLALYPTATDLIYTEYARKYYLNQNAYSAGQSVVLYGKLRAPALSDDTDLLPFSPADDDQENSGNHAIVLLAYSDALASDKMNDTPRAEDQEKRAMGLLDIVWKPMGERKAQKLAERQPMFNTHDMFSDNRPRGGSTRIGNF